EYYCETWDNGLNVLVF
nr:immunoglobulin light chain junction region [Macaca mulatta]MOW60505.1 immunoglobulin light chain junction region [Macaca mulatta]MOW60538.1 immunoglobulin light chain junction region [Macaca mulatta]